jgi:pantetheine-phosphate adenylyltransferase
MMRTAVYAGSFDPITNGHLSILDEAARLFDRVFALVAVNPAKSTMFSEEERLGLVRESVRHLPNVSCASTHGLVVEFARSQGARYLIRGLRGSIDSDYEMSLAQINQTLAPEISTLFLLARPEAAVVSSSLLKELARCGGELGRYCPPGVEQALRARTPHAGGA